MRMKSTGLGRMELVGQFEEIVPNGDFLILSVRTTEPVRWHLRTALSRKDAISVLKLLLKPCILVSVLSWLFKRTDGEMPTDY